MNFWEKGFLTTGIVIVLTASAYAGHVWLQSQHAGLLAAPQLGPFLIALGICIGVSFLALGLIAFFDRARREGGQRIDMIDEREMLVSLHAVAGSGHVQSFGIYVSLIAFFIHRDANVLFYTVFAATLAADVTRCALQVINYKRSL